eukprot:gnl/TRDRNA2_/TRDRNA2_176498_c0_seq4.p1 gnl/TRDRNA2_/TRDRNA2_176498_c0~~gnl/TRDRNA2_/TRDRNA2_176498_c0_seq4.p1  ORF type:complete len:237 (+),score=41.43 gnl/TRDRNA2_/TRDRNA2_176498_c0_seq4:59-769(+)
MMLSYQHVSPTMAGDGFTRGSLHVRTVTQPASVRDTCLDQVELDDDEAELSPKIPAIKPSSCRGGHPTNTSSGTTKNLAALVAQIKESPGSSQQRHSRSPLFLDKLGMRRAQLSPEITKQIMGLFRKMDADGNSEVSREDAKQFFQGNFGKLSANAMFNEVDVNNNHVITPAEFLSFWEQVKRSGYSDKDIVHELGELLQGNAWVDWDDQRQTYDITHTHSTTTYQKQLSCKTLAA